MFRVKVDNPLDSYGPIDIFICPRIRYQAKNLEFRVYLPNATIVQSGTPICLVNETEQNLACSFNAGTPPYVLISIPVVMELCPLSIKLTTLGTLPYGYRLPVTDYGEHVIKIEIYDDTGTHIEEAEYRLETAPKEFGAISMDHLHVTRDA